MVIEYVNPTPPPPINVELGIGSARHAFRPPWYAEGCKLALFDPGCRINIDVIIMRNRPAFAIVAERRLQPDIATGSRRSFGAKNADGVRQLYDALQHDVNRLLRIVENAYFLRAIRGKG